MNQGRDTRNTQANQYIRDLMLEILNLEKEFTSNLDSLGNQELLSLEKRLKKKKSVQWRIIEGLYPTQDILNLYRSYLILGGDDLDFDSEVVKFHFKEYINEYNKYIHYTIRSKEFYNSKKNKHIKNQLKINPTTPKKLEKFINSLSSHLSIKHVDIHTFIFNLLIKSVVSTNYRMGLDFSTNNFLNLTFMHKYLKDFFIILYLISIDKIDHIRLEKEINISKSEMNDINSILLTIILIFLENSTYTLESSFKKKLEEYEKFFLGIKTTIEYLKKQNISYKKNPNSVLEGSRINNEGIYTYIHTVEKKIIDNNNTLYLTKPIKTAKKEIYKDILKITLSGKNSEKLNINYLKLNNLIPCFSEIDVHHFKKHIQYLKKIAENLRSSELIFKLLNMIKILDKSEKVEIKSYYKLIIIIQNLIKSWFLGVEKLVSFYHFNSFSLKKYNIESLEWKKKLLVLKDDYLVYTKDKKKRKTISTLPIRNLNSNNLNLSNNFTFSILKPLLVIVKVRYRNNYSYEYYLTDGFLRNTNSIVNTKNNKVYPKLYPDSDPIKSLSYQKNLKFYFNLDYINLLILILKHKDKIFKNYATKVSSLLNEFLDSLHEREMVLILFNYIKKYKIEYLYFNWFFDTRLRMYAYSSLAPTSNRLVRFIYVLEKYSTKKTFKDRERYFKSLDKAIKVCNSRELKLFKNGKIKPFTIEDTNKLFLVILSGKFFKFGPPVKSILDFLKFWNFLHSKKYFIDEDANFLNEPACNGIDELKKNKFYYINNFILYSYFIYKKNLGSKKDTLELTYYLYLFSSYVDENKLKEGLVEVDVSSSAIQLSGILYGVKKTSPSEPKTLTKLNVTLNNFHPQDPYLIVRDLILTYLVYLNIRIHPILKDRNIYKNIAMTTIYGAALSPSIIRLKDKINKIHSLYKISKDLNSQNFFYTEDEVNLISKIIFSIASSDNRSRENLKKLIDNINVFRLPNAKIDKMKIDEIEKYFLSKKIFNLGPEYLKKEAEVNFYLNMGVYSINSQKLSLIYHNTQTRISSDFLQSRGKFTHNSKKNKFINPGHIPFLKGLKGTRVNLGTEQFSQEYWLLTKIDLKKIKFFKKTPLTDYEKSLLIKTYIEEIILKKKRGVTSDIEKYYELNSFSLSLSDLEKKKIIFLAKKIYPFREKFLNGFRANITHGIDSWIVRNIIINLNKKNIKLITNHDAFLINPNHLEDLTLEYSRSLESVKIELNEKEYCYDNLDVEDNLPFN